MAANMELPDNWLEDAMEDAHFSILADHDLSFVMSNIPGIRLTVPISDEAADELYRRLNDRFISYTGRTLADYVRRGNRNAG